jgi:site-specific recombinase XerD
MAHRQDDKFASINRRDTAAVLADYAAWLAEQPLSARTREAYLAAVTAFVAWLDQRDAGPGEALGAPRARDLAARDYKRHMKVDRGLSPASVNQALAGMDHLFRFLGLGAAIVRREELPRSAPRALDVEQQRLLLQAAEESTARDRAIVALLLFTGLRLSEAAALQLADVRISARKGLVVVRSGKGDAYREVELNALVRAMLDECGWRRPVVTACHPRPIARRPSAIWRSISDARRDPDRQPTRRVGALPRGDRRGVADRVLLLRRRRA